MFKRRALDVTEDLLQGEHGVHEAIHKLICARTKSHTQLLKWASGEDNALILTLFKRLAEIQWIYNEATKEMADKHLELSRALKRIFQKEKQLEELKKELQGSETKKAKLQKQVETATKKGDSTKAQSLEADLSSQITVHDHLTVSSEAKAQKLEVFKLTQLKKALVCQAEGVITLSGHCQQLYASQMQLIDLLPDSPLESSEKRDEVERSMVDVVGKVSELLNTHSPANGDLNVEGTPTECDKTHLFPISGFIKRHKSAESINSADTKPDPKEEVRPEVNYTQGMYCEIVIPDVSGKGVPTLRNKGVPMRRSQSGSSPLINRKSFPERYKSDIISDRLPEDRDALCGDIPMDSDWDNMSNPDTSSDDFEPDKSYARLTIVSSPTSLRSSSVSPDIDACNGYAKPADVLPFDVGNFREQQRRMRKTVPTSPPIPEGQSAPVSPYETIEDIRKLKKEQASKRKGTQSENYHNDDHVYSKPFDAVSFHKPIRVSVDTAKSRLIAASKSSGKLIERAARSVHQTGSNENLSIDSRAKAVSPSQTESSLRLPVPLTKTRSFPPNDSTPSEDDLEGVVRTSSVGSMRNFPTVPPKPVAATIRNLRTGQATVITGGGGKKPAVKPKPTGQ